MIGTNNNYKLLYYSDTNIETRSRKHHVDTSDVSADSRGIKRVLRKELKLIK